MNEDTNIDYRDTVLPIRWLITGPPKSGKTTFARTFKDAVFIDADQGLIGARLAGEKLHTIVPDSWIDVMVLTLKILRHEPIEEFDGLVPKALVIDTISKLYTTPMKSILSTEPRRLMGQRVDEVTPPAPNRRLFPQQSDYGAALMYILGWLTDLKAFKGQLVVLAHESIIQDGLTGRIVGGLQLPGQLKDLLPGEFDVYGRMRSPTNAGEEYKISFQSDGLFNLGDRTGRLPALADPDFRVLAKHLQVPD